MIGRYFDRKTGQLVIDQSQRKWIPHIWDLRWRLVYDNKEPKFGPWNQTSDHEAGQAIKQTRSGLVCAQIEGKHRMTRETHVMIGVPANFYVEHRWLFSTGMPQRARIIPIKLIPSVHGLMIMTDEEYITCYIDGKIVREPHFERSVTHG